MMPKFMEIKVDDVSFRGPFKDAHGAQYGEISFSGDVIKVDSSNMASLIRILRMYETLSKSVG